MSFNSAPVMAATVVAVDVGKNTAVLSATDSARHRLLGPVEFAMTAPAVAAVVGRVSAVLPGAAVKVGVEAAGHYHRPLLGSGLWPAGWELLELSPARVSEQRRVQGRRRSYGQMVAAEAQIAKLLPDTPFAVLLTVPGWGTIRAGNYGAAVGDPDRWPGARQLYRASGLSPAQYESAGKRRDGSISREGSVALRRALIDLGIGLWRSDPAARRYGQQLRARGKKGGVIGCAMANRANKIAYALVRDQSGYDPDRWA